MLWFDLQRRSGATLTRQLYDQLVSRILSGVLPAGTQLPSSRDLATESAVARNVVLEVYEQLVAEGYLEARPGSGTFVAPLRWQTPPAAAPARVRPSLEESRPMRRDVIAFTSGVPDLGQFPRGRWLRCLRRAGFFGPASQWGYTEPAGDPALRAAIAAYLHRVKGLACSAANVFVTSGTAHAVLLVGLALRPRSAGALVEDPTVRFVPAILQRCGYRVATVPVDDRGLDVGALPARPRAGLLVASVSHQFPLGGTLPIQRRIALLEYARRHDLLVVEDDYDGEFRFAGAPASSLFRLDPQRVLHAGTFSKSLSPALRLGYLVVPDVCIAAFEQVLGEIHFTGSGLNQAALAHFIRDGHLDRHVVRMKRRYQRKSRLLERLLSEAFGPAVRISGNGTGLHLVATFAPPLRRRLTAARLAAAGVEADTVDDFAVGRRRHPGALVLAYGNLGPDELREGVRRLARAAA